MLKRVKSYLLYGKYHTAIEHSSNNNGEALIGTILKKTTMQVDITSSFKEVSIEACLQHLNKKQHVALIINNEHVLTKRISNTNTDSLKLVYVAFPNINIDDFYCEIVNQREYSFISICRKSYVESLISNYKSHRIVVIDVFLGSLVISGILNYINKNEIEVSNSVIPLKDGLIDAIEKKSSHAQRNYNINGLKTSNIQLLSTCGALISVLKNYGHNTNFEKNKKIWLDTYRSGRFFSLFSKFGLGFILILLLINFGFFNHYFTHVNTLQETVQVNLSTKQRILEMDTQVNKTKKMVDDMLKSNNSNSSFYVNELIANLPNTILLETLNYQPLKKRIKAEQAISISPQTVLIKGESSNSNIFSSWLSKLEQLKWLSNIEIIDYNDSSKTKSNFSLKLTLLNGQ